MKKGSSQWWEGIEQIWKIWRASFSASRRCFDCSRSGERQKDADAQSSNGRYDSDESTMDFYLIVTYYLKQKTKMKINETFEKWRYMAPFQKHTLFRNVSLMDSVWNFSNKRIVPNTLLRF